MEHLSSGSLWDNILSFRYMRVGAIAVAAGAVLIGGYYAYDAYANNREAEANQLFAESYGIYENAMNTDEKDQAKKDMILEEAEAAFKSGYKQFSNTRLAPFFLGMQADVALKRGNTKEAIELLKKMLALAPANPTDNPLFGLYATKLALIKLDQPDMIQEGLDELTKLANNANNDVQDFALYCLGEYYAQHGENEKASQAWRTIRDIGQRGARPIPSPWLGLVQQRMTT